MSKRIEFRPNRAALTGEIRVPGDKSMTHRAFLFAALASGRSVIRTRTLGRDNLATLRIVRQLGVQVRASFTRQIIDVAKEEGFADAKLATGEQCEIIIESRGAAALTQPAEKLECGNSGTTARLMCGILSGCPFEATLIGDESLSKRPFRRVKQPLEQMGASFSAETLPITIRGGGLHGIAYDSPHASAQVKSAVLLAGLSTDGIVSVTEPKRSRDHTERMLRSMGCDVREETLSDGRNKVFFGERRLPLEPLEFHVPGDFSSAAFFLVAGSLVPGSNFVIRDVGVNETRIGLLHLLRRMGAKIDLQNARIVAGENVADITVQHSQLKGIEVSADDVVEAIDEVPILSVAALFAKGKTTISGAEELRVKESDRIAVMCRLLSAHGAKVKEKPDGLIVESGAALRSVDVSELPRTKDHRISMSAAVLDYALSGKFAILDPDNVETSFPGFISCFQQLTNEPA